VKEKSGQNVYERGKSRDVTETGFRTLKEPRLAYELSTNRLQYFVSETK